jgi:hypothetical protein
MLRKQFLVLLFALAILTLCASICGAALPTTPEAVKEWFDAKFVFIAMGLGLLWKYVPQLKGITNSAIPWVNAVAYMLAKAGTVGTVALLTGVTPAYAGGIDLGGLLGVGLLGAAHSIAARQGWEAFLRPIVETISLALTTKRHPAAA